MEPSESILLYTLGDESKLYKLDAEFALDDKLGTGNIRGT